uniref:MULE transposase domain-containing protein n=1 Tax=Cacopsylla melanoneura TaxID=428564 RepID=A0A8D8V3P6_9HEMI
MEFITSERSKTLLVFEGFKFSFQKLLKGDVERWICCTKSCKCSVKLINGNGTFKSCPKFYFQVFTLLGLKNNVYIPLVFLLLPGKTKSIYKQAFQHVKSQCSSLVGKEFYPSEVFADFELAIHGAIQDVWSDVIRRGCRFHLGQSWWRKIQTSGCTFRFSMRGLR